MAGNDVPLPATFLLTRNAALDLRRIYTRSLREWGDDVADRYLADLYAAMGVAADNPAKGQAKRSVVEVAGKTINVRLPEALYNQIEALCD